MTKSGNTNIKQSPATPTQFHNEGKMSSSRPKIDIKSNPKPRIKPENIGPIRTSRNTYGSNNHYNAEPSKTNSGNHNRKNTGKKPDTPIWLICLAVAVILLLGGVIISECVIIKNKNNSTYNTGNSSSVVDSINDKLDTTSMQQVDYHDSYSIEAPEPAPEPEAQPSPEELLLQKYKDNSLKTGATPYSRLYGGNSSSGESRIVIKAPKVCDAMVIIKDVAGNIVKHAYIKSDHTYSFSVNAGTYQPFFVFGNSWCPEIEAPNGLYGFFLEDVSVSKDSPQYLEDYPKIRNYPQKSNQRLIS